MSYPAATLSFLPSKKKWYVYVTIPPELRRAMGNQVQKRLSTGTGDAREAKRRLHDVAARIYAEFDSHKANPRLDWAKHVDGKFGLLRGHEVNFDGLTDASLEELVTVLTLQLEAMRSLPSDPDSAVVVDDALDKIKALEATRPSQDSLIWPLAEEFLEKEQFNRVQIKKDTIRALKEFSEFIGETAVSEIKQKELYDYAEHLANEKNQANRTITGRIGKLSNLFNYCVRKGYLPSSPTVGLKLSRFGAQPVRYSPFTKDELFKIFALPMADRERLLFSILVTSGMRLDEAALLKWENIKEQDGILFYDLTEEGYLVKNKGSARKVPVHPSVRLPERGTGRLFDYKTNADGKTTTASETCNKLIRKVTTDKRHVVHSFRHTFKDMMREARVHPELHNYLSGHSAGDAAGRYGIGPSLKVRYDAIVKVAHPWLDCGVIESNEASDEAAS
jgi:integrase